MLQGASSPSTAAVQRGGVDGQDGAAGSANAISINEAHRSQSTLASSQSHSATSTSTANSSNPFSSALHDSPGSSSLSQASSRLYAPRRNHTISSPGRRALNSRRLAQHFEVPEASASSPFSQEDAEPATPTSPGTNSLKAIMGAADDDHDWERMIRNNAPLADDPSPAIGERFEGRSLGPSHLRTGSSSLAGVGDLSSSSSGAGGVRRHQSLNHAPGHRLHHHRLQARASDLFAPGSASTSFGQAIPIRAGTPGTGSSGSHSATSSPIAPGGPATPWTQPLSPGAKRLPSLITNRDALARAAVGAEGPPPGASQTLAGPVSAAAYVPPIGHGHARTQSSDSPALFAPSRGLGPSAPAKAEEHHATGASAAARAAALSGPFTAMPAPGAGSSRNEWDSLLQPTPGNGQPWNADRGFAGMGGPAGADFKKAFGPGTAGWPFQPTQGAQGPPSQWGLGLTPAAFAGPESAAAQTNAQTLALSMALAQQQARTNALFAEDDVQRSLKYEIWASTEKGNARLDKAWRESAHLGPLYLFFSVNASGHFNGMAQMLTPLDYSTSSNVWAQEGKWKGTFKVRWIYVKDVPNSQLRHIRLTNTPENKPITQSRDTQELPVAAGKELIRIMHGYSARTTLLQDWAFYEAQQESQRQVKQQPDQQIASALQGNHVGPLDLSASQSSSSAPGHQNFSS
ncbi:Uncharacterized high-glucose-regulated protein [Ceraceosorus bombacis]|uniref:Uncharacterized high-glucose-regulated protein n=1 Tax=Ceraceosorus bombacis TaxID=401625 RepID=A0A0P1BSG5_9BASI|nr:Uncharacterized high-glucose-regulated protein [Ceraceosorus bombacis]